MSKKESNPGPPDIQHKPKAPNGPPDSSDKVMTKNRVEVMNKLIGKTIKAAEIINANYAKNLKTHVRIMFEDGTEVVIYGGCWEIAPAAKGV